MSHDIETVQLESSTYNLPFVIESTASPVSETAMTIEEAVTAITAFFTQRS